MSKTVLFDLVFLTPRQKVRFGPRTQNDDFLGTRPRAAPLGSCQKNSSFFVLGTKLLFGHHGWDSRIGNVKSGCWGHMPIDREPEIPLSRLRPASLFSGNTRLLE